MVSLFSELEGHVGFPFEALAEAINRNSETKIPTDLFGKMTVEDNSLLRALY